MVISSPLGAGSKRLSEATTPPLLRQGSSESLRAWPAVRPPLRRSSTDSQRKPFSHNVPPLSSIPSVYFEEDFHLENPRTFDVVSERSDIVPRPSKNAEAEIGEREGIGMNGSAKAPAVSARKTLATNAILQEKLSWYMDTVEMHLISSISSASTSFFAALGSLRGLNSESQESIARIQRLRADLELVDRDMALGGLKVINMQRRRANVRKLVAAIEQLKQIVDEARTCQNLIDQGLIDDALDQVDKLEDLSAGKGTARKGENGSEGNSEAHEAVDLQGLKVLANLSADISNFRARIGKGFEQRFLDVLLGDLRRHVQIVSVRDTFQRWSNTNQRSQSGHSRTPSVARSTIAQDDELQVQLQSNINALHRVRHTPFATAAYRDAVLREAKNLIRKQLPSSDDDDTESIASVSTRGGRQRTQQEKSAILARNLRSLDPQEAEDLLARIYSCFVEFLRRLAVQVKVLLDVTSVMSTNPALGMNRSLSRSSSYQGVDGRMSSVNPTNDTAIRSQEDAIRHVDISSVLGEVVDIAQAQITKILKVRNEQTIRLPIGRFIRYFTLNRAFADDCELVSGRGGSALKSLVNAQIKDFVIQLGDSEKQCLARTMDADLWDAADFGERESQVLSRLLESSTKDPDAWLRNSGLLNSDGLDGGPKQSTNGAMTNGDASRTGTPNGSALPGGKEKIRRAVLDEQTYILPKSALATLDGVDKLESIIACIPSTTQEVSAILLDYLKLFTSRLCQLILGAGATRSAGLKNITTKHLALASQALSFIIALIPYIREFVRRHPTQSNTILIEFDKVKRLYQEHQNGIQDKFVEIMSGRSRTHVTALKKISWDDVGAQRPPINTYMETLIKETSTLHRVLSKHLSEVVVTSVMTPIFESYKEQWGQAFRTVNITTKEGMERYVCRRMNYHPKSSYVLTPLIFTVCYAMLKQ